jgi:hypothetical protein
MKRAIHCALLVLRAPPHRVPRVQGGKYMMLPCIAYKLCRLKRARCDVYFQFQRLNVNPLFQCHRAHRITSATSIPAHGATAATTA